MAAAFQFGLLQEGLGQVDALDYTPASGADLVLVAEDVTDLLVAEDVTDLLVAIPTSLRELPWLLSWLDAEPPPDPGAYWRPFASMGALELGPALVAGAQLLTGWLSPLSDGAETVEVVETHPAAQFIAITPPVGTTFVEALLPFSQFVLDGGYLYPPNFKMMLIGQVGTPATVDHPGVYGFNAGTKTFEFFPGITGNIVLRYRVTKAATFTLHFGIVEAIADPQGSGNYAPQHTPWDASTWSLTEAAFWTLAGTYLEAVSPANYDGAEWVLPMPTRAQLGGNDWVVLRLIATPTGRAPIRMYFLLAAPAA
ncbi:MAG: hypothetical protein WCS72_12715 [Deltaproteobacteria bacterium]